MYESDCLLRMNQSGVPFPGPLVCDGTIHRFSRDAKKTQPDEWYVAYSGQLASGQPFFCCSYGSWSDGNKFEYKSWEDAPNKIHYSPIDRKELQSKIEENRRLALIEQQKQHQEAAKKAQEIKRRRSRTGTNTTAKKSRRPRSQTPQNRSDVY